MESCEIVLIVRWQSFQKLRLKHMKRVLKHIQRSSEWKKNTPYIILHFWYKFLLSRKLDIKAYWTAWQSRLSNPPWWISLLRDVISGSNFTPRCRTTISWLMMMRIMTWYAFVILQKIRCKCKAKSQNCFLAKICVNPFCSCFIIMVHFWHMQNAMLIVADFPLLSPSLGFGRGWELLAVNIKIDNNVYK